MTIVVLTELAALAALRFDFTLANLKVVILLPFVWLLFESAKRPTDVQSTQRRESVATPRG